MPYKSLYGHDPEYIRVFFFNSNFKESRDNSRGNGENVSLAKFSLNWVKNSFI